METIFVLRMKEEFGSGTKSATCTSISCRKAIGVPNLSEPYEISYNLAVRSSHAQKRTYMEGKRGDVKINCKNKMTI